MSFPLVTYWEGHIIYVNTPVKNTSSGSDWEETIQHPNWGMLSQTTGLDLWKKKKKSQYQKEKYQNMHWQWCGKIGILYIAGGNVKWCSYCGKSLVAPQKIKYRITLRPGNSTPGSILKRQQTGSTQTKTCTWIFMATLFTVAQRWKQSTCPSADEWKNQLGSIHPVGYY